MLRSKLANEDFAQPSGEQIAKMIPLLQWAASVNAFSERAKPSSVAAPDWNTLDRRIQILAKDIIATFDVLTAPGADHASSITSESRRLFDELLWCAKTARLIGAPEVSRKILERALQFSPKSRAANWGMAQVLKRPEDNAAIEAHIQIYLDTTDQPNPKAFVLAASVKEEERLRREKVRIIRDAASSAVPVAEKLKDPLHAWVQAVKHHGMGDKELAIINCAHAVHGFSDLSILSLGQNIVEMLWDSGQKESAVAAQRRAVKLKYQQAPKEQERSGAPLSFWNIYDFREYVDGKRVCLVANSGALVDSGLGDWIDGHDIVVRFNSFEIRPRDTGSKIDIHAAIHKHNFNLDVPCHLRMIFSGDPRGWRTFMRERIVPGAQAHVADSSLRWPLRDPALIGDRSGAGIPTSGFNMMRLLHFLGVCREISLVGFDFYEGGIFRIEEAMAVPLAEAHSASDEKQWVTQRVSHVDGIIKHMLTRDVAFAYGGLDIDSERLMVAN